MDAEAAIESGGLFELADPVRRRLYEFVAGRDEPVRRDEAANAAGISRTLAAYHLDRLADAGLLAIGYARPAGQAGPGAGRPAKVYRRVQTDVSVTVPARDYGLVADLLAQAVSSEQSGVVRSALITAAEDEGRRAGETATRRGSGRDVDLVDTLRRRGYEPAVTDTGDLALRNCPFHQLAQRHVELVCGVNYALLRGLLAGCGEDPNRAELAPRADRCCVTIHRMPHDTRTGSLHS